MHVSGDREVQFNLTVNEFGATKMLRATSHQFPNLIVTGTDESDLWDCLGPVITSLFKAQGDDVRALSLDRSNGLHDIRVHVKVTAVRDREPIPRAH